MIWLLVCAKYAIQIFYCIAQVELSDLKNDSNHLVGVWYSGFGFVHIPKC